MQPKGRIPPMTIPGTGFVKKDCSGIWRGIWFVLTGCSIACKAAEREDFITNSSIFDQQSIISRSVDKLGALTHSFLESKVGAEEGEGHGDSKPQSQNGHQSAEGDRCWGTFHPKDQVHQEEVCEHNTREERGTEDTERDNTCENDKRSAKAFTAQLFTPGQKQSRKRET